MDVENDGPPPAPIAPGSAPVVTDPRWLGALQAVVAEPDRLEIHAQPIVELTSGAIVGYEMLSRFTGPWRASPDVWFAAAEHWGYNSVLQARVLRMGIAARSILPADTFLSVNVDPHLLADAEVAQALTGSADLSRFVLELTEHTRASPGSDTLAVLAHVRQAGGMVAMDDAGSGYAGLSALLRMRPQILKLDRELITGLDVDPVKRALVEVLGDLAGRMDTWILAEGIETRAELEAVIRLGVPLGQGWGLARPERVMLAALDHDLVGHIRSTAARSSLHSYVASLVRPVRTGTDPTTCDVLTNGAGHPSRVRDDRDNWAAAMVVSPSTEVSEAARRAMARGAEDRYAPLVCTDGQGLVIGTIAIFDLVAALTSADPTDRINGPPPADHTESRSDSRHPFPTARTKESTEMKTFRCGDVVPGCTQRFTGTTEDILAQVARHAFADHGMADIPPTILARVQAAMTPAVES